jgi:hypothetical protein
MEREGKRLGEREEVLERVCLSVSVRMSASVGRVRGVYASTIPRLCLGFYASHALYALASMPCTLTHDLARPQNDGAHDSQ